MWILCNNYGKKLAYLKPPDYAQWPRVSRYGLKTLLCIFWNSPGFHHDRISAMSLMATPYATLLGIIVPTTTRHQKITGLYVWKKMLVSTRQINDKLLFYIKLLCLSPLTILF